MVVILSHCRHGHNPRVNADRNTYLQPSSVRTHVEYITLTRRRQHRMNDKLLLLHSVFFFLSHFLSLSLSYTNTYTHSLSRSFHSEVLPSTGLGTSSSAGGEVIGIGSGHSHLPTRVWSPKEGTGCFMCVPFSSHYMQLNYVFNSIIFSQSIDYCY